jgi:serine phosphatase RsbU (regulator of sigma subunit)
VTDDAGQSLFRSEYEQELEHWLRHRFNVLCGLFVVLLLVSLFGSIIDPEPLFVLIIDVIEHLVELGVIAWFLLHGRHRFMTRDDAIRGAVWLIGLLGAATVASRSIQFGGGARAAGDILLDFFAWHFIASLVLPWTPRESLRPMVPLMLVWAVLLLFFGETPLASRALTVCFAPGVLIPGLALSAWRLRRHSRSFRHAMMSRQFMSMRREFTQARSVHEAMFPRPFNDGFVRIDHRYSPMRELGGDFIHVHVSPGGEVALTLIDVTGHGLPAALTVNRLCGELDRIRAEDPSVRPGDLLSALNRYVALTLIHHAIFATAIVIAIDPVAGRLQWASAGHPPAFLRGANGAVTELPATAAVLGAVPPEVFAGAQREIELTPGDVVVAFTDGAFEARDRLGRALGLHTLREAMKSSPPPPDWPSMLTGLVDRHRAGRAEDDVLIASMRFLAYRRAGAEAALRGAVGAPSP